MNSSQNQMIRTGVMTTNKDKNKGKNNEEIEGKIGPLPGYSANKPAYLVTVSSEAYEAKRSMPNGTSYVSFKLNYESQVLKIQGWEISKGTTVDNLEDAEKHANREQYLDIHFPWHRVASIRNITFRRG